MDFDEFLGRLEKQEVITNEEKRRNAIYTILRSKPIEYKKALMKSAMDRMVWYFENHSFGVISVCNAHYSKKKNYDRQLSLMFKLRKQKLHCIPHIGFWEMLGYRSLFIPCISRKCVSILARDMKLKTFIWGEKSIWKCYRTCNQNIVFKGTKLKIVDIDTDFMFYTKIASQKNRYIETVNNIEKQSNNTDCRTKILVLLIQIKINDLKRIENELFQIK